MNVLVTGGTGFTGSHLTQRLLARGDTVSVLDNQKGIACDELEANGAKITIGSVHRPRAAPAHGAGTGGHLPPRRRLPQGQPAQARLLGHQRHRHARACSSSREDAGVRKVVYCSTQGVHGNVDNPPGDEDTPIEPEDYYQFTKYEGEKVAQEFIRDGMDITILRPTAIYGPGDPGRFLMLFRQVKKGIFPFFGKGKALYHPVYIDNFVDAFELAAEKPAGKRHRPTSSPTTSTSPSRRSCRRSRAIMEVDLKDPAPALLAAVLPSPPAWSCSTSRCPGIRRSSAAAPTGSARTALSRSTRPAPNSATTPNVDLDEGLRRTYEWYRDNGYL